jgi:tetratricopeptide (TPR) repeat protein
MPKLARTPIGQPAATSTPRPASRLAELLTVRLSRRQHLWLMLVLLIALLVRGAYLWGQYRNSPIFDYPQMDGRVHHEWATRIASGEGMEPRPYLRAPLYYYLLGWLYKLTGANVLAARIAGCLLGALNCYLIARLAALLAGFRVGLLAGLIAAFYWPLVYFDFELLTVGLEICLNTTLLWLLLVAGRRGSTAWFAAAGVIWGLSAITRPNVLAFAPVVWLWAWWTSRQPSPARRLIAPLAATIGLALPIAPVALRNYFVGGEPVLIASTSGINFYIGNNPESTGYLAIVPEARLDWRDWLIDIKQIPEEELGRSLTDREVSRYWFDRALKWIRSSPGAWATHMFTKLRLFWSPLEIPNNQPIWQTVRQAEVANLFWIGFPVVAALAVPALVLLRRRWRAWAVPVAFAAIYMATVVAFFCPARYRIPVVPVFIILAAYAICRIAEYVRQRRLVPVGCFGAGVAIVAIFVATNPPGNDTYRKRLEAEWHFTLGRHFVTPAPYGGGDLERAEQEYRQAVKLEPSAAYRHTALARTLFSLGQTQDAGQEFLNALRANPSDGPTHMYFGLFMASLNQLDQAAREYQAALHFKPSLALAHQHLGALLMQTNQDAAAAEQLRKALQISPDLAEARLNLAAVTLRQAKTDQEVQAAIDDLEIVLRDKPKQPTAWQNLGIAQARLRQPDKAIESFRHALENDPALTDVSISLARLLWLAGRHAEAIDTLSQAVQQNPGNADLLAETAALLSTAPEAELRNGERALRLAQHAVDMTPQPTLQMLDALASSFAEVGQYDDAVATAERALSQATAAGDQRSIREFTAKADLYRQHKPLRRGK